MSTPRFCTEQQVRQWEVLGLPLDHYGETQILACLACGEDSLKASIPINLAHCTACGWNATADKLAGLLEARLPNPQPEPEPAAVQIAVEMDTPFDQRMHALLGERGL